MLEDFHERAAEQHEQAAEAHRAAAAHYRNNDHVNGKLQSIKAVDKSKSADFHSVLANKKSQEQKHPGGLATVFDSEAARQKLP